MIIDAIRELNRSTPFRPYTIRLASGTVHRVPHPEFIMIAPKGTWVVVSDENDHPYWISALLIEQVSLQTTSTQTG